MLFKRQRKFPHIIFSILLIVVFVGPVLLLVVQSLAGIWQWPHLIPQSWNLRAFEFFGRQAGIIIHSIAVSISYAVSTVGLSFVLCYFPAEALARDHLPNQTLIETVLLLPVLLPQITFSLGIHHIFIHMGLTDNWLGVVLILTIFSYPFMLRALIAGFHINGKNFALAAKNLGAKSWQVLLHVELPLMLPALISGGSVVFLVAFTDYFLVFLIGGGVVQGFSGYLFPFLNSSDRPTAALLSIVFLAIPFLIFALIELTVTRWYRRWGMENHSA